MPPEGRGRGWLLVLALAPLACVSSEGQPPDKRAAATTPDAAQSSGAPAVPEAARAAEPPTTTAAPQPSEAPKPAETPKATRATVPPPAPVPPPATVAQAATVEPSAPIKPGTLAWERRTLATEFTCEGAHFADLDQDGHNDVIAGPYWYAGPEHRTRHELLPPVVVDPAGYSEHFFVWPRDFDGDGWIDLLTVGFPGKAAHWLRNPLGSGAKPGQHWERFLVHPAVDNESPAFADLTGDGAPELVFHTSGRFGFASPAAADPRAPWVFRPISKAFEIGQFTHGLGVGDVDGDGRADILWREGWLQQPDNPAAQAEWSFHPSRFGTQGGAQMFVRDVDGDGDGDVITSLAAHGFGLAWFENQGGGSSFLEHRLMGEKPDESPHGICFAELHALDMADVDGDGLDDIITGKRWWSHGAKGDPQPGSAPVLTWFRLERGPQGAQFVPTQIDDAAGVGVQLITGDVDGDGLRDVVVGSKRGVFALLQRRLAQAELDARAARKPTFDFEDGDLRGWTASGDAFALQPVRGDAPAARQREASLHQGEHWIGGYERLGDAPKGTLTSDLFPVEQSWASFLVGGGGSEQTRVELVLEEDNRVIFRTGAANHESMQRVVADLRPYAGKRMRIRLVDNAAGGWGHLNFDDFRFHAERPVVERPAGVPAILPFDEVPNAGLPAPEAARAMSVPEGFQVDVIAAEPDLHQPIALTVDDRGRLWVAEAFTYPKRRPGDKGADNIVVLEDADHDGTFERRTLFQQDLNLVSGLEVGFGGVWVGAAPYLMFIPDRDGDLVPDGPAEILLDGWGYEDTHETLNAFTWGPDGWLYGCHGVFTHSRVGKPGIADDQRTPLNAGVWRYHPTRHEFEVFAWGTSNPWGVDFDLRGQAFVTACVIPHLFHLAQGGRYERQSGTHFDAHPYGEITTIADHRHYLGAQPHAGNNRSSATGGGHAHCGLLIYGETAFPGEYRGALLFANIHGNRINRDVVERSGSGFVGKHGPDFLLANDRWFRGINLRSGPGGELYLIDWYDQQACHLTTPEIWDRTNGRLYRVSYGAPQPQSLDMGKMPSAELVDLLSSRSEWFARRARRLLQERGRDEASEAALRARLLEPGADVTAVRALWALHGMGALSESLGRDALASPHEYVRAWAVQLLLEDREVEPETLALLEGLAQNDPSAVVRLYLASALQRLPLQSRWQMAHHLVMRGEDQDDANIPVVLWYGIEPLMSVDVVQAMALFAHAKLERVARFTVRRAAAERALHPALMHALFVSYPAQIRWKLEAALEGLADQRNVGMPVGWPQLYEGLTRHEDPKVRELAASLAVAFGDPTALPGLRAKLADRQAPTDARLQALEALVRARDPRAEPLLRELLDDEAVCGAVIRALAASEDVAGARALLERYPKLGVEDRRDALNTLSSRATFASLLLDGVEAGTIPRADLGAFVARKLESLGDPALAARLESLWGRARPTSEIRAARIAELTRALTPEVLAQADRPMGRAVFARTCQQCHTLFESGGKVGPDLTGSNRADLDYLLSNVVDPNAVVGKDYLATLVWTHDGRLVTGIQRAANESTVTLQTENETLVLGRDEIETLRLSDLSTMPEGLLDTLSAEEIRDLVAYLQGATQAPIAAGPAEARMLFDGVSLKGWSGDPAVWSVEDGAIVGRTEKGLPNNAFLASELDLRDFRLSLEVLLVEDRGNSGIQFRSRLLEGGDVAGYQADIGPDWWGKLYEEHGRALLWERSGEAHVKKGEWNRYVIEARGHKLRTWINDQACVDLEDPTGALRGVLALQVHSGGPTEVRFRGLVLELL